MEDKLQSRCSRIGPRNTLWRPTKMSSPTAQGPARESKESKPHRASPPGSRRLVARQAEATQIQAERRSADGGQLGRAPAPCGSGHRPQRRAVGHPAASSPAPSGRGPRARLHGARARARHAALRQRQGRRQSPRGKSACARLRRDLRPGAQRQAGAAPLRQVTGRYDLVSILNFFDSVDL